MVKETKKTRNKGKITIVLRKGTAILLALIMVLTVGVTNAKAETVGIVYGKENFEWLKDELDQIVDAVIDPTKTNQSGQTNYYMDSAGREVKRVYYNPNVSGNVTITYCDPENTNKVIGHKNISCSSFNGGDSWQCTYNLYNSDIMNWASRLKYYEIILNGSLQGHGNNSVSIVSGTKTITEQDYFYPNILKKGNLELIQTLTVKTYNVENGVETLTKTNVTQNKVIEKGDDKEEAKISNVETSFLENGSKKVIYEFYELNSEQNAVLTTKVTETLEPCAGFDGGAKYVLTDRITETYKNDALEQKTDDDFMSGLSVKKASTVYDASGNVIGTETVAAEPTSETDYLGQTHYTATFTASPAAITATGKVITTLNGKGGLVEKDGLVEKEYDNSGKLVRTITRDADCNILRYEIIDYSTTGTISYKDALTGDKGREIKTSSVDPEGSDRVRVAETIYDNNVEIWYIDTIYIGENDIIQTRTTFKKQGPSRTLSETKESFDDQGKLTEIEEKEYEAENNGNYTLKTYDGTGTLICETTYKEKPSDGIRSCKTEVYKDAAGNITNETISTENNDGTQIILEWYYENNEKKYGFEQQLNNKYDITSEKYIDPDGNEIDKPVTVTVSLSETSFTYSGAEIKPSVRVMTDDTQIDAAEYTVTYENNTEVGTATVKVSDVWGGTYKVDGSATFEITRAPISPTVEMSDMMVGSVASQPVISGNPGNGAVTIAYKVKDADDATYTDKVPQTAGRYTVRVSIAETKNYKAGTATADFSVKVPEQSPVTDPDEGNTSGSGSGTSSGTEGETTSGTEGETTSGTEGGTTSGTEGGTTSGTTSGTESGNASGETPDSEKDKEVKEENSGSVTVREEKTNEDGSTSVKEETVNADGSTYVKEETVNADGSTVVKEEITGADGSTSVKEETVNADGSTVVKEEITGADGSTSVKEETVNADGSTVVKEETTEADGSTVVKEETKDASGAGSATEVVSDAEGNVLRTTEETTTVSKKGTVTLKALTKNADDSTVEKTQKQYRADEEGTVKTVTNLTATTADGSVVKTKETMLVDAQGNTTAVSKKTATTEDGKKEVTTTSAQLDAKGKGVIVSETKVGKETTASETYALSSKGTAKVTKLESADATVVVPETLEIAGKEVPVTSISKNAMKNNKKITAVEIGENITTVGAGAFKGSKNLSNISITASITKISKNAFAGIAPNAVFKIRGTKKDFERIVALLKESGVADTVTFELDKS